MPIEVFADAALAAPLSCLLGVAISNINGNRHIGILLNDGGEGKLLHLAWHQDVSFDAVGSEYFWIPAGLAYEDAFVLSAALVAAASQHPLPTISYSPLYEGDYFLGSTLTYIRDEPGAGLTCATFVLAVFDAFGYHLIDHTNWPQRSGDIQWRDEIISNLKKHPRRSSPADIQEHINAIMQHPNVYRFRPEEVAASVASAMLPMGFADAEREGRGILKKI